jgi:hypothetical protein
MFLALALGIGLGPILTATEPLHLPPARCEPLIRGVWWWIHPQNDQPHLKETLDAMEAVGIFQPGRMGLGVLESGESAI